MKFIKSDNIYIAMRQTGNQGNILGISFGENSEPEVIKCDFDKIEKSGPQTSTEEVLEQVVDVLQVNNQYFGTAYKISKIYFCPFERPDGKVYALLASYLIERYHEGTPFEENKVNFKTM